MLVSRGDWRISDHFEVSGGFSGLTRGGFRYVLFLSRNRSFSGQAFGESLMAEGRKTAPFSNV